jgi:hypothetical protein
VAALRPDFQVGSVISSKLPHCEQRKSWEGECVTEPQPMQRKQNVTCGGADSEPLSEAVADGMESEIISGLANIDLSY